MTLTVCLTATGQDEQLSQKDARRYARQVTTKIETYHHRISSKTEKTLTRLSRWESRIKKVLDKTSPEASQRLFAEGQPTFGSLLQKLKEGEAVAARYTRPYDQYIDDMSTGLRYLQKEQQQASQTLDEYKTALSGLDSLSTTLSKTEFISTFIAKRRKQLLQETMKYAGQIPALKKLNKEAWYYAEAIRNYKELFADAGKREQIARKLLSEIPAYQRFAKENSMLASLFPIPQGSGGGNAPSLAGLQTRAGVQDMIQQRIAAGGPNGAAQIQQNLMEAQSKLADIKDKILKGGHIGADGDVEMPDFKPNGQRSKTFMQRLEYGFDMQFSKGQSFLPATSDLGLNLGYRITDRYVAGIGVSYKLGLGSIDRIRLSSEGAGLRSYLDWKIKGAWHATGGYEMYYLNAFKSIAELRGSPWQQSGLIGISRQYKAGKKMKGEVRVMWDFLYRQHAPQGAPVVFRMGYKL